MSDGLKVAWFERAKLYAEGSKLRAEGDLLFANAVIAAYGPKEPIDWTDTGCLVRGREFKNDEPI